MAPDDHCLVRHWRDAGARLARPASRMAGFPCQHVPVVVGRGMTETFNEGRGHATQTARALIAIARQAGPTLLIAAQTLSEENASTTILRKPGFRLLGSVHHPEDGEIWEWRL